MGRIARFATLHRTLLIWFTAGSSEAAAGRAAPAAELVGDCAAARWRERARGACSAAMSTTTTVTHPDGTSISTATTAADSSVGATCHTESAPVKESDLVAQLRSELEFERGRRTDLGLQLMKVTAPGALPALRAVRTSSVCVNCWADLSHPRRVALAGVGWVCICARRAGVGGWVWVCVGRLVDAQQGDALRDVRRGWTGHGQPPSLAPHARHRAPSVHPSLRTPL